MNTELEEALENLLEQKGYIIYDLDTYECSIVLEGYSNYGQHYNFKLDTPLLNYVRRYR